MSKIKLFNTLPSSMVSSQNLFVNDYDVVSFKRYTEDELYKEYFLDNRLSNKNRLCILDSNYDLFSGDSFDVYKYLLVIGELKPNYYIIPYTIYDTTKSNQMYKEWFIEGSLRSVVDVYKIYKSLPLIVPFSDNMDVYVKYLRNMLAEKMLLDVYAQANESIYIGINDQMHFLGGLGDVLSKSSMVDLYKTYYPIMNEEALYSMGRTLLMERESDVFGPLLEELNIRDVKYHLIETSHPSELVFHKGLNNPRICTIDTSLAIDCAMRDILINKDIKSLFTRPSKFDYYLGGVELDEQKTINLLKNINTIKQM